MPQCRARRCNIGDWWISAQQARIISGTNNFQRDVKHNPPRFNFFEGRTVEELRQQATDALAARVGDASTGPCLERSTWTHCLLFSVGDHRCLDFEREDAEPDLPNLVIAKRLWR